MATMQTLKDRIQKYYPGAFVSMSASGKYFIEYDEQNLNDVFLLEDSDTIEEAWQRTLEAMKIQRNINRTHPLKQMISEHKKRESQERIANRIHG
jgi:hypothetical protein